MQEKKQVYTETTVVSNATALPTSDIMLAGNEGASPELWRFAAEQNERLAALALC